jgi:asparagine synthetase B (glutamine-hydrolysing)
MIFFDSFISADLDLQSLAQALYFASRGKGSIKDHKSGEMQEYTSTARVILSGLGADELLGGYVRHRNAFKHAGWQGLLDEVRFQFVI